MKPEFSIILPVHNRARSLSRAINSVLRQMFQNWELIIIDDASTDSSLEIAQSFADSRIRLICVSINGGAAKARNVGIAASQGTFISFLDSDDEYWPEFLAESRTRLANASLQTGIVWTGVCYVRTRHGKVSVTKSLWQPPQDPSPYFTFLSDLRIGTNSGITVRREVFDKVGYFDERLPAAEDTDLFLRIAQEYSFAIVPIHLINIYQVQDDRLSKRFDKIAFAYDMIIPKHLETIEAHKNLRIKYFYKAFWLNLHLGNVSQARHYFKRFRRDSPFSVKAWFIWFVFRSFGRNFGARVHVTLGSVSSLM